jgi:hypothetical protein
VLLSISRSKVNEIVVLLEIPVEASVGEVELIAKDRSILLEEEVLFVVFEGFEQLSKKNMLTTKRNMLEKPFFIMAYLV